MKNKFNIGDILVDNAGRIITIIESSERKRKYRFYTALYEANNTTFTCHPRYIESYYKLSGCPENEQNPT